MLYLKYLAMKFAIKFPKVVMLPSHVYHKVMGNLCYLIGNRDKAMDHDITAHLQHNLPMIELTMSAPEFIFQGCLLNYFEYNGDTTIISMRENLCNDWMTFKRDYPLLHRQPNIEWIVDSMISDGVFSEHHKCALMSGMHPVFDMVRARCELLNVPMPQLSN